MKYRYDYQLEPEDGGFAITCPDIPEVISWAETKEKAGEIAQDAVLAALVGYIQAKKDVPRSKRRADLPFVALDPVVAAKLGLYQAMKNAGITNTALAERLGVTEGAVRKLLNLDHRSHIDAVIVALLQLGKSVTLEISDAA